MLRWRSNTWARWLAWTVCFGLIQAGALYTSLMVDQAYPSLPWVLLAGQVVVALLIGVRLRTWWWTLGPVVAYGVLAAIYLFEANDQYQAMERPRLEGIAWDVFAVMIGAVVVLGPCTMAALIGSAWATRSRARVSGRHAGKRPDTPRRGVMSSHDGVTARDVLVARSMAMTGSLSPSNLEQGAPSSTWQRLAPNRAEAVAGPTFADRTSDA